MFLLDPRTVRSNRLESPVTSPAHKSVCCVQVRRAHLQMAFSCAFPQSLPSYAGGKCDAIKVLWRMNKVTV